MSVKLHTSFNHSDWSVADPANWNLWQKIAAATRGIITPGNIVSCGGAILVLVGLFHLTHDVTLSGVLLVATGRLADAIDGYIADKTQTKSLIGEAIDSTMDKLVAIATLITIFAYELLPLLVIFIIASHTILNSLIAIFGRLRKVRLHPSLLGKLATFMMWLTILGFLTTEFLRAKTDFDFIASLIYWISWLLFIVFCYMAGRSTLDYSQQIALKNQKK